MNKDSGKDRVRQYNKSQVPRLRWTPDLHQHFVQAVERLGGKHKATPKRILQMMGSVRGLKISHIKSHLQMYRSTKSSNNIDVLIPVKHVRIRRTHAKDLGGVFFSVRSPKREWEDHKAARDFNREEINISKETHGVLQWMKEANHFQNQDMHDRLFCRRTKEEGNIGKNFDLSLSISTKQREAKGEDDMICTLLNPTSNSLLTTRDFHTRENNQINLDLTI